MKRITIVLTIILFCLSLSGCSKQTDGEQSVRTAPDFKPLNSIEDGRKNVYLIVKNLESSYWNVIIEGAKDGGDEFGCNVYYSGSYVESDWEEQYRLIDDATDAGADAILLAPDDSVRLSGKIDETYQKGIPIILIDTIANTDNYDICYMTDNLIAGQKAAEEMIAQLKKSGVSDNDSIQVGLQLGAVSSQTISERLAGFFKYWSSNAPETWEIISDIKCNDGVLEKAVECAEDLLEYPRLRGVFGTNNCSTSGFAKVIKEHERKDIVVVGFDYSEDIAALINGDYMAATILQRQYYMSHTGIETALKIIDGENTDVKFVDMGVVVVNKDTINQTEVKETLLHN